MLRMASWLKLRSPSLLLEHPTASSSSEVAIAMNSNAAFAPFLREKPRLRRTGATQSKIGGRG